MGQEPSRKTARLRPLISLRAYFFFAFGAAGLYVPYFPAWLLARGFHGLELGMLLCLLPVSAFFAPLVLGMLADKLGLRGRLITLASALSTAGMGLVVFFVAEGRELKFAALLLALALFALGRAPMLSLGDVMAMENDPHYGRTRLWGSVGFVSCSLLGGIWLRTSHPLEVPSAIILVHFLTTLISLTLPRVTALPPRPALQDAGALLKSGRFQRFLIMSSFAYGALSAYDFTSTLRLQELGATGQTIGLYWATATTAEVLLLFFGFRITSLFPAERLLPWLLCLGAARWLVMAEAGSPWLLVLVQPTHALVFGLFLLCSVDVLKRSAQGRGMATAQGLLSLGSSVGSSAGLLSWGPLYAAYGSRTIFHLGAVLSLGAALLAFAVRQAHRTET